MEGMAAVFTANMGSVGGITKIVYIMSFDDARKFCSDRRTQMLRSSFFFEKLTNFRDEKGRLIAKHFIKDNGKFDELIEELDLEVFSIDDF